MDAVKFIDYTFSYPHSQSPILKNISLTVPMEDFLLLCGTTGSGKTTLLRSIKGEIAPVGKTAGKITILDNLRDSKENIENSIAVGFVSQNPENQIVMDTVWHELAFGLENMGLPTHIIRRRIGETVNFFGIQHWINKKTCELSGGQKQILNLASVMVMQPKILIMDEPTSQLDPIAAKEFLQMVSRLNLELGTTIIISEHRLEDVLPLVSNVAFLENGSLLCCTSPRQFICKLYEQNNEFVKALPCAARIAASLGEQHDFPISVKQCKTWLKGHDNNILPCVDNFSKTVKSKAILSAKGLWFKYNKSNDFVIRDTSLDLYPNTVHSIVGGNGSGKSTMLHLLCGVYKPQRGKVKKSDGVRVGLLSQNCKVLFTCDTVYDELMVSGNQYNYGEAEVEAVIKRLSLSHLKKRHPYDLSGGEMEKTALAKILLLSPKVLLLDEPTKGVDAKSKEELVTIISEERRGGKAVLIVTHDLEFAAKVSDYSSMFFDGGIICSDTGREFFKSNVFYTTGTNRIMRDYSPDCILVEDVKHIE